MADEIIKESELPGKSKKLLDQITSRDNVDHMFRELRDYHAYGLFKMVLASRMTGKIETLTDMLCKAQVENPDLVDVVLDYLVVGISILQSPAKDVEEFCDQGKEWYITNARRAVRDILIVIADEASDEVNKRK